MVHWVINSVGSECYLDRSIIPITPNVPLKKLAINLNIVAMY